MPERLRLGSDITHLAQGGEGSIIIYLSPCGGKESEKRGAALRKMRRREIEMVGRRPLFSV